MSGNIKAVLLMGALTGLFLMIGNAIAGTGGMIIAFVFAVAMNMGAWWFSDSMALRMSGAQEVSEEEMPELHQMVTELSERANMPKPRVYIIETAMPNAFATGRSPQKGAVAFTTGIMSMLNRDELAGVLAHELAHIKNRDTLISSVAATIGGAITMLADMAMWGMIFGGFGGDDEDGAGSIVGGIVMIIVAPIAAMIIQMAISRAREFTADATGAEIAGDPMALASALEKIEAYARGGHQDGFEPRPATSHMYIIPPLGGGLARLFSTHPDTQERIARLHAMQTSGAVA